MIQIIQRNWWVLIAIRKYLQRNKLEFNNIEDDKENAFAIRNTTVEFKKMLSPSKYEDEDHEVAYVSAIEQTKRHRLSSNEASIDYEDYPEFLDVTKDNVNFEVHMNNEEIEK